MISTKKIQKVSTAKRIISSSIVKPFVASATILCIDRFFFMNMNLKSNLYFAGSVAASTFVSSSIAESTRNMFPTSTMIGSLGKNLESRVLEIACVSGTAYATNRFLLKNEYNLNELGWRLGAIAVGDIISEFASEIILRM